MAPFGRVSFVAALAATAVGAAAVGAGSQQYSYAAVIDAGSSGSRVYLYYWPRRVFEVDEFLPPKNISVPVLSVNSTFTCTPGVDSPEGVEKLKGIVEQARLRLVQETSAEEPGRTAIFLKATAGLRILTSARRDAQLRSVRAMLRASGFLFRADSQARVISGEEEGVFGWLTVNYALGRLNYTAPGTLQGSFGALDLGGASTQVTFKPSSPDILENSYRLSLGGAVVEDLYTHSFLYFGANEAIRRADGAAVYAAWPSYPSGPAPASASSPCRFTGSAVNYTDPATGALVEVTGSGSLAACRADVVGSLLNKAALCLTVPKPQPPASPLRSVRGGGGRSVAGLRAVPSPAPAINASAPGCSFQGVYQPPVRGLRLVAFSGFTFTWNLLGMPGEGGTLEEFRSRADTLCGLTWAEAQAQYPSVPPKFLAGYCFGAAYTLGLLVDGYGLDPNDPAALRVAASAGEYGWALGSVLFEANSQPFTVSVPAPKPAPAADQVPLYVVSALLAAACLVIVGLAVFSRRVVRGRAPVPLASETHLPDQTEAKDTINPLAD